MVFSTVIQVLARQFKQLNLSLLEVPPSQEGDDQDICYLGPNGEDSPDLVRYCGDLDLGMRANVASWYLSPERHVVEGLLALMVFGSILIKISPLLANNIQETASRIQHPVWMKPVTFVCFGGVVLYKWFEHENKYAFMTMPCNMEWIFMALICTCGPKVQAFCLEMTATYVMLVILAIVSPDTTDCVMPFQIPFFYINHYALLLIPLAYMFNGTLQMSLKSSSFQLHFLWWLMAYALFGVVCFGLCTFLAPLTGLNVNYMMHPPPNQDLFVGPWYRLQMTPFFGILFAMSRVSLVCIAYLMDLVIPPAAPIKKQKLT